MATHYDDLRRRRHDAPEEKPRRCHDLIKISVGWAMLIGVMTFMLRADIETGHRIPWSLAWILYLPSLIVLQKGFSASRDQLSNHRIAGAQTCLGLLAMIYIFTTMMTQIDPSPVNGCDPAFYGRWLSAELYCPNLFEYRWGFWGQALPVAFTILMTALAHLSYLVFTLQRKDAR